MGKYNFDEIIDRHGTSCNKWEYNIPEDVVPMWVADMDFAAAPEIREAMQKRLDHPVYGYTHHSKELKDAIVSWVGRHYHWDIQSEWLGFSPGVVPALVMSLLSLTTPGDRIVIMTPVYHPFYSSIEENGRVIINHQLDCDENGRYSINFERLEAQIDNRCKAIMMCNPHNPAGRVWTKEELLEEVWQLSPVGADIATVTVHIKKIREKIEYDTSNPQYIETIWGVGYRFKM